MHKIDGSGNVSGLFTEGNPATAQLATAVTADWLNAVQTEVVNVIAAAGLVLNKADNTQLRQALTILSQGRLNTPFKPRASSPANMRIILGAGFVFRPPTLSPIGEQTTPVFIAPGSNARIDRVVVDIATGILEVVAGAASASPSPPDIPTGKLPIAQVVLIAGQTSILTTDIVDERAIWALGLGQAAFANLNGNVVMVNNSLVAKGAIPIGGEISYPCAALPDPLDGEGTFQWSEGAALLRSVYPVCFSRMGVVHGAGTTTEQAESNLYFCLPDRRGYVMRGVDFEAGRDPDKSSREQQAPGGNTGNLVGSVQGDSMRRHQHESPFMGTDGGFGIFGARFTAWPYGYSGRTRTGNRVGDNGASGQSRQTLLTSPQTAADGTLDNRGELNAAGAGETRMKNQYTRFAVRVL